MGTYTSLIQDLKNSHSNVKEYLQKTLSTQTFIAVERDAKYEVIDEVLHELKECWGNIPINVEEYLKYTLIPKMVNIYAPFDTNFDEVVSEMIHDVSGYLGKNMSDDDFQDMRAWVDEHLSVEWYYEIIDFMLEDRPLDDALVNDWLIKFNDHLGDKYTMDYLLGKESIERLPISFNDIFDYPLTENLATLSIKGNKYKLVYAIINTNEANDGMKCMVISVNEPNDLGVYGYQQYEVEEIAEMKVGQVFYTRSETEVLVRMA